MFICFIIASVLLIIAGGIGIAYQIDRRISRMVDSDFKAMGAWDE